MKAAFLAALYKSPWLLLAIALVLLFGLWLVLSHSYALSLRSPDGTQVDLKPAQPVTQTR